jgi:hypothetical protein
METALDDSLLDAWKTPEMPAKGQRKPFIPDIVNTIDRRSSILEIEEPSRYSNAAWTIDSAERYAMTYRQTPFTHEWGRTVSRIVKICSLKFLKMKHTYLDSPYMSVKTIFSRQIFLMSPLDCIFNEFLSNWGGGCGWSKNLKNKAKNKKFSATPKNTIRAGEGVRPIHIGSGDTGPGGRLGG